MPAKKSDKTLNQKIADLDNRVEWFYGDDFKLEEATDKYKETLVLAKEIETDLNNLKNEIEVLSEDFSKQFNQCYNKLMDNSKQSFPLPGQNGAPNMAAGPGTMPMGGNGMQTMQPQQGMMMNQPFVGQNGQPMPGMAPAVADDKTDLIKNIIIGAAAFLAVVFMFLFFLKMKDYNEVKSDIDSQIAVAVAGAVDENTLKLENEFAEREKSPSRSFTGPEDYGSLSFEYPKTWALYVSADASKGGDYVAYFNPVQIDAINNKNSLYALRLTITTKSSESIIADYQSKMKNKNSNLSMDTFVINDVTINRYTGNIPGTEYNGYIVVVKIRDKTAILQTDSYLFESDFNNILNTLDFNS